MERFGYCSKCACWWLTETVDGRRVYETCPAGHGLLVEREPPPMPEELRPGVVAEWGEGGE